MKENSFDEKILASSIKAYFFKEESFLGPWVVENKENKKDTDRGRIVITSHGESSSPNEITLYGSMPILKVKRKGNLKTRYLILDKTDNYIGSFYNKLNLRTFTKTGILEDEKGKQMLIVNYASSEINDMNGQKIAYFTYKNETQKKPRILRKTKFTLNIEEHTFDKIFLLAISIGIHYGWFAFPPGTFG